MIFEDFINDIKAISKIANDEDIRDIVSHVDFIEKKLIIIIIIIHKKIYYYKILIYLFVIFNFPHSKIFF